MRLNLFGRKSGRQHITLDLPAGEKAGRNSSNLELREEGGGGWIGRAMSFSVGARSGEMASAIRESSQPRSSDLDLLLDDSYEEKQKRRTLKNVMKAVGYVLGVVTFILLIITTIAVTVYGFRDRNTTNDHVAFYSAGAFVLLTVPISVREIIMHLTNFYIPSVQKYVIRILWMVPLYSIQSWLSLRFHDSSLYFESIRDFYER